MTERCKANPCCGNFYGNCSPPLPQDNSGFKNLNKEYAKEIAAGATDRKMAEKMRINK